MFLSMPPARRLLREEFKSGRLDAAESKAMVLQSLCDRLKFEPEAAAEIHEGIFRDRLEQFLADKVITGNAGRVSCTGARHRRQTQREAEGASDTQAALACSLPSFGSECWPSMLAALPFPSPPSL
jgi:Chloroplast envelope transporter